MKKTWTLYPTQRLTKSIQQAANCLQWLGVRLPLLILLFSSAHIQAQCPPGGGITGESYFLATQEDVDQFLADYPNCTEIQGSLTLNCGLCVTEIDDLSPLSQLTSMGGLIITNTNLTSLAGLENLTSLGKLNLTLNNSLTSIDALQNITSLINGLKINHCASLSSLSGLENLTSIEKDFRLQANASLTTLESLANLTTINGNLTLLGNSSLNSLHGLENITSVGGNLYIELNNNLTNLTELENITSIGGGILIINNDNLSSLTGLENITSIGGKLIIVNNNNLNSLIGLENITSVGDEIMISSNDNLSSLTGLENITSIEVRLMINNNDNLSSLTELENINNFSGSLVITYNNILSTCCTALPFIQQTDLVDISDNAPGCNSEQDIIDHCTTTPCEVISISSSNDNITISGLNAAPVSKVLVFNNNWQVQFSCFGDCYATETIPLPEGDYIVKVSLHDGGWSQICDVQENIAVGGGGGGGGGDCGDLTISHTGSSITVSGLDGSAVSKLQIFDESWNMVFSCFGDCNPTETVTGLSGKYFVRTSLHDSGYEKICELEENIDLDNSGGGGGDPCDALGVEVSDGILSVQGISDALVSKVIVFDAGWNTLYNCFEQGDCTPPASLILSDGSYHIRVGRYNATWEPICEQLFDIEVSAGAGAALAANAQEDALFLLAGKSGRSTRLDWISNMDYVAERYLIERSADGLHFEQIGDLSTLFSDSDIHNYALHDEKPLSGYNFYRIKAQLADGQYRFSNVRRLHFDVAFEQFHLFPNPVSEQLAVDLADLGKVDCRLRIFDALGQEVYQVDAPADSGQVLFIDTRTFAPGVYTLSVTSQSMARQAKKFVVVRR